MMVTGAISRLLVVALLVPMLLTAAPARAQAPLPATEAPPFHAQLAAWADRLDARAAELEAQPVLPATRIGPGALLKKGAEGERVERLAQRLIELGHLPPDLRTGRFDDAIDAAVRAFQVGLGLKADGKVGGGTRIALDRTPQEAARLMRQSAQAMRAFRETAPESVLIVNLPSQETTLVRGDRLELTMRSIVGRPERETPLLEDRITHIIVNPTWTVPPTVLKKDKLPNLRERGTTGIENAIVYLDGEPVMPETVDWKTVTPGRVRIVQQPGDWNALGRFRFNLTNPHNIYLHGTNEPRLFDRDLRTISSGCVRLQDARGLAELLLAEVGVTPQKIDDLLAKGEPQWIKVRPLPVRFVYWTATVAPDGTIRLHPDVYDLGEERAPTGA
ncbi:L,D-transpeptidase family protein [Azospirillum sp.]|uniref:L,D-transpeptidase family protein n=1 Tax=Azospirillum sp. TaxID=34012 RepID=UPI003D72464C